MNETICIHTNTTNKEIQETNIFIKILLVSTAECKSGFREYNTYMLRSMIQINNKNYMEPCVRQYKCGNPTKYGKNLLL